MIPVLFTNAELDCEIYACNLNVILCENELIKLIIETRNNVRSENVTSVMKWANKW